MDENNRNNSGSIYDDIDKITLNEIYQSLDKVNPSIKNKNNAQKKQENIPQECLYDKTYVCPVCGNNFKSKTIRKGKVRFISNEFDLKPRYEPIQPDYYDIVLCDKCGYASISSKFDKITSVQEELIRKNITPRFYPKQYPELYTVDIAIERYKLALINTIMKKGKASEIAFISMKLAWLYRDKKDAKNEFTYLKAAYKGFNDAFTNESFPMCGLEENTLLYIIAAIGSKIGKIEDSLKILSRLIVKKGLNARLKLKIFELREILKKIKT